MGFCVIIHDVQRADFCRMLEVLETNPFKVQWIGIFKCWKQHFTVLERFTGMLPLLIRDATEFPQYQFVNTPCFSCSLHHLSQILSQYSPRKGHCALSVTSQCYWPETPMQNRQTTINHVHMHAGTMPNKFKKINKRCKCSHC